MIFEKKVLYLTQERDHRQVPLRVLAPPSTLRTDKPIKKVLRNQIGRVEVRYMFIFLI